MLVSLSLSLSGPQTHTESESIFIFMAAARARGLVALAASSSYGAAARAAPYMTSTVASTGSRIGGEVVIRSRGAHAGAAGCVANAVVSCVQRSGKSARHYHVHSWRRTVTTTLSTTASRRCGTACVGLLLSQCYVRNSELVAQCYEAAATADHAAAERGVNEPGRVRRAIDAASSRFRSMRLAVTDKVKAYVEKPSQLLLIGDIRGYHKRRGLVRVVYRALRMATRALYIAVIFTPLLASAPAAILMGETVRRYWYALLVSTLASGGPAFIKWGQWASARLDMFPKSLCDELKTLQSGAPAHSASVTRRTVAAAFGDLPEDLFDEFEYDPIASGSIAQIHTAVLGERGAEATGMPAGTKLAIKVRHPGVEELLETDFALMTLFVRGLSMLPGFDAYVGIEESIKQFGVPLKQQVDLSLEARSLSIFAHNFSHLSDTVRFPEPLYPYVHPSVLVETFEPGMCVTDYIDQCGDSSSREKLAEIGIRSLLKMMLVDNFIHADLHPGNLLVRLNERQGVVRADSMPQLVVLDVGMTTELKKDDSMNVLSFFQAITQQDGDSLAKCVLLLSTNGCENPKAFRSEMASRFHTYQQAQNNANLSDCMTDLLNIVRKHRVSFNGDVFNVIMTTVVLEGWSCKLNPNISLISMIKKAFVELHNMAVFKETLATWKPWFF